MNDGPAHKTTTRGGFWLLCLIAAGCQGLATSPSGAGLGENPLREPAAAEAFVAPSAVVADPAEVARCDSHPDDAQVRPAQALLPVDEDPPDSQARQNKANDTPPEAASEPALRQSHESAGQEPYLIDLPTALRLAGANNLQIAFAAERVRQAAAQMDQADLLWVPSLNAGLVYNNHAGRLQETEGRVLEISRNSLFVGAGAVVGGTATAGGASGPVRMVVDLPLVDVLFERLAARQIVRAADADHTATFNDTLLQVAAAYLELLRAQSRVAIAQEAVENAEVVAKITADFARAGEGLEADAQRLQAELNSRRRDLFRAKESVAVASAELVRLLRLDPTVTLVPTDDHAAPIDVVDGGMALGNLIAQAQSARPEADRSGALVEETRLRYSQERWRPWIPHLYAGFSGGGFGGGEGSDVRNFSDRTDFDVGAVWEWQNLGLGNRARQREQASVHRQAHLAADQVRDLIASEVSRAFHQVQFRSGQIDTARPQVAAAQQALRLNLDGIRGRALRAIEAQQAITALAAARGQYLDSVIDYNVAQFSLVRAVGNPPSLIRGQ